MSAAHRRLPCSRLVVGISLSAAIMGCAFPSRELGDGDRRPPAQQELPAENFTHPPRRSHDPAALYFTFDQLEHHYRVPGEFTHRLSGDQYGFESLSFIITETHPGGGPGLHYHDTEEAHILLNGSARYRVGEETFTVQAPYVAKVPAGVPHTFINAGNQPFNLVAVFASKHPNTRRIGPNPLVEAAANVQTPPVPDKPQATACAVRHQRDVGPDRIDGCGPADASRRGLSQRIAAR